MVERLLRLNTYVFISYLLLGYLVRILENLKELSIIFSLRKQMEQPPSFLVCVGVGLQ